jgi:lipid-binding SYLF domain-containing protein
MRTVLIASAVCLAAASADASVTTNPKARLAAGARVVRTIQASIPAGYWDKARCVVVFPELSNSEFEYVVGAKYAKGVMTCRTGDHWSAPAFVKIDKGKRMFQLGATGLSVVLLVMNESAVQTLMRQDVTLGADVSLAPGPIDDQLHIDVNTLTADVLTYAQAKGLYMNLAGGVLEADREANRDMYGHGASLSTIIAGHGVSAPSEANGLLAELSNQPAAPGVAVEWRRVPMAGSPELVAAAVPAIADDDLRARVAEMRQNLDRILAGTTPGPVGMTGTVGQASDTVPIDRARLEQMRLQLNAILAALNRR